MVAGQPMQVHRHIVVIQIASERIVVNLKRLCFAESCEKQKTIHKIYQGHNLTTKEHITRLPFHGMESSLDASGFRLGVATEVEE